MIPVIDSHIHLFPASETNSLSWYASDHPLAGQHSVEEYREATTPEPSLAGFIFVETDRKNDLKSGELDGSGWRGPFTELAWIKRIALGQPRPGEGHSTEDRELCLGIVLWAPLPSTADAMRLYLLRVEEAAGLAWPKVKGYRYLLQDEPHGTMLQDNFIENTKLLGRRGSTFDVCIDLHRRGERQIQDLVAFARLTRDKVPENEKVVLVLDHICKPDMSASDPVSDVSFMTWRAAMYELGQEERTYIKLSGGFAEMGDAIDGLSSNDICKVLEKWFRVILDSFGPRRIMFGSDWPVCTINMSNAWSRWHDVTVQLCQESGLTPEEQGMIFSGTARQAYNL
ncbi:uncharacterized protein FSUBG_11737 [Fusarium subglutinans]|uniref:Amidohydrolase-related domain-containing protein n=1 Tax=Gibberella subglutinans TaxID=42677 RepID=A0A8H5LBF8_GIBSU|nr:uncharacterized protein FSUBG_11737 [Fusarium subglutinans]KAF5587621.1 hypothetical protein FSUBG_11737 [Fusarium subglutinans]